MVKIKTLKQVCALCGDARMVPPPLLRVTPPRSSEPYLCERCTPPAKPEPTDGR